MLGLVGLPPFRKFGPSLTYIGSVADASDLTTYNFGNFAIPRDGLVVVGAVGRNPAGTRTIGSVSIGGTNGSIYVNPSGSFNPNGFAGRSVSAGTHNVSVTFSGAMLRASCHVWLLENLLSTTPVDTDGINNNTTGTSYSLTADISADGFALYVGMKTDITEGVAFSSATGRYDAATEIQMYAADKVSPTQLLNHVETMSWTVSSARSGSVVTFR